MLEPTSAESAPAADYATRDTDVPFSDHGECGSTGPLLAPPLQVLLNPSVTYRPPFPTEVTEPTTPRERAGGLELPKLRIGDAKTRDVDLTIEAKVGSGGIGLVESARQACLGRRVAIKRVRPDRRGVTTEALLQREATLMGRLDHPAIPPVHLLGRDDEGQPVLVMKLVVGQSWETLLHADRKPPEDQRTRPLLYKREPLRADFLRKHLNVLLRIGDALSFAHDQGIIHCDIKPENVVVGDHGQVYLLDWGIAAQLNGLGEHRSRGFAGTPIYAAPEMVSPRPTLTVRTDIYLLGATLFHILQGRAPHTGSDVSKVLACLQQNPTPELEGVPATLREICVKAMARRPEDRYDSVKAMMGEVRYYLDHKAMMELHDQASTSLEQMERLAETGNLNSEEFEFLGYGCRYALERVCQAWPENTKVRDELARCVLLLCDASIEQRRIAAARALLNQYSIVTGADHPDRPWWWSSSEGYSRTLLARAKRIETLADQVVSRNDELSMSIQVRLVEQLADQKREYSLLKHWYDELLAAYQTLQRKRSLKP